jgi:Zn-dependent M32 family carboxypeptidase
MKGISVIALTVLATGCATTTKEASYWTEKSGVVVVHHVRDGVDHIEKLSEQKLSDSEVQAQHLPKGKYYKVVEVEQNAAPQTKRVESDAPRLVRTPKPGVDAAKLAEVTNQITELKRQISTVVAENQRLESVLNNSPNESVNPGLRNNLGAQ